MVIGLFKCVRYSALIQQNRAVSDSVCIGYIVRISKKLKNVLLNLYSHLLAPGLAAVFIERNYEHFVVLLGYHVDSV